MKIEQMKNELEVELTRLANRIDRHRKSISPAPSDRAWVKQWPGLGSARTWAKILKGDLETLSVEAQLPNYRGVLSVLDSKTTSYTAEELYADLPPAQALTLTVVRLLHHHGKDRLILVEGGSGSSKTSSLQILSTHEAAGNLVLVEASEVTWRGPRAAMHDILRALNVSEDNIPHDTAARLNKLLSILNRKGRVILAVDEAHHANGSILNLFKTLLNNTDVILVLAGMKTLFRKLRAIASEEAKQLIHNRLYARIELNGPDQEGAELFLTRRLGLDSQDQRNYWKPNTVKMIVEKSRQCGHWAFLRRVVDHLKDSGVTGYEADDAAMLSAVATAQAEII